MTKPDKTLAKVLADAQDPEALERLRLFELMSAMFRVSVAGVDVTKYRGPPVAEPELNRPAAEAPAKRRRRRRK